MSLFPSPCLVCGKSAYELVCPDCLKRISEQEKLRHFSLLYIEDAVSLFDYGNAELDRLLFKLKNRGETDAVAFFARLLCARLSEFPAAFSAVTYVPRRRSRVLRDGFDQSARLSRDLSMLCRIPRKRLVLRRGSSKRQHGLDREARVENVRGKFRAKNAAGETVLLIDDVITTGATCEEVARILKEAGAKAVYAMALFRGGN